MSSVNCDMNVLGVCGLGMLLTYKRKRIGLSDAP